MRKDLIKFLGLRNMIQVCSHSHLLLSGLNQLGLPLSYWTRSTSKAGKPSGLCPSTQHGVW